MSGMRRPWLDSDHSFDPPSRSPRLACRCPRCGKGKLFDGFLTLRPRCEACGLDYAFADSADGPAVFVIFFAGFIVVGSALVTEILYEPPFWVHALLWAPLILVTTLLPLRPMKGLMIALQYHHKAAEGRSGRTARDAGERAPCAQRACCCRRVRAGRARRPARARHLADRAQGLEGSADRHACAAARRGSPWRLPPPEAGPTLQPGECEFRRVRLRIELRHRRGSAGLCRRLGAADDVIARLFGLCAGPAAGGATIVVNRGFVPEGRRRAATRAAGDRRQCCGGRRRASWFVSERCVGRIWFVRDQRAMARPPAGVRSRRSLSSWKPAAARRTAAPGALNVGCATNICNTRSPGMGSPGAGRMLCCSRCGAAA